MRSLLIVPGAGFRCKLQAFQTRVLKDHGVGQGLAFKSQFAAAMWRFSIPGDKIVPALMTIGTLTGSMDRHASFLDLKVVNHDWSFYRSRFDAPAGANQPL